VVDKRIQDEWPFSIILAWKSDQQKRGTGMEKTEEDEVKQKKGRGGGKVEKKKNAAIIRCGGTLHAIF
jgi:hypothetical protein